MTRLFTSSIFIALIQLIYVSCNPTPQYFPSFNKSAAIAEAQPTWWLSQIARKGTVAYGSPGYQVYRNVKDFGAKGDGTTDDTAAINAAITQGNRCGKGCDSSTITPALVYFPPGTYIVSQPIVQYYYTQFVGDAVSHPILKASPGFAGIAVIDSDPYDNGVNWYTNQNNFFRQIRNFEIDVTAMPPDRGACIHWQVAQATSLQNIIFRMRTDEGTSQLGIFMDNGSGGFMSDLIFYGGKYGAFFGNQQFTTRNLIFNNCKTAIFMNWNWAWTLSGITISNARIGIEMANRDLQSSKISQSVGSVLLVDSRIINTPIGITTAYSTSQSDTNGTLILDNVDFSQNVPVAILNDATKSTILPGNTKVTSWAQGRTYDSRTRNGAVQNSQTVIAKPTNLLSTSGNVFVRSKPQYENIPVTSFKSVKSAGAKGDGVTDDTAAIQALFNSVGPNDVVYFDHGAYVVTNTIRVPKEIKITGEIWPLIMAGGTAFQDASKPTPVFQVGQPGDVGHVEMSDLIFETIGAQPGAIMVQWNVAQSCQGSVGMWDVHVRIGGSAGTKLQSNTCTKQPTGTTVNPACQGAFLMLHVTPKASIYLENNWFWVADHELDLSDHSQISLYNGRGALIESTEGPVWLYGTSSEHSVLYNYQISNAKNVYMALIQTETPYFQSNPDATKPFTPNAAFSDPVFSGSSTSKKAWGLRVTRSSQVFVYGAGLYSFFDNYDQKCIGTASCQDNMVSIENSSSVHLYGLSTIASTNMVTLNGASAALDKENRNNFCATVARFSN
ncbi:Pectin lyase-like protein [Erysiphe pulchra]|uniref:Pectin lyase-like protein n=1 Tax=Erysiphe pulchra TaxID=225359 RepID=A0A2S4PNJ4_9PEZI|nr:Pectin lyase-like protein [Erysiphe pulchra]